MFYIYYFLLIPLSSYLVPFVPLTFPSPVKDCLAIGKVGEVLKNGTDRRVKKL